MSIKTMAYFLASNCIPPCIYWVKTILL
jgi:hypothetical protein